MFKTTQVIHVKRKRDDAPVDSLYLQTSNKRARPNLAPQVYFKRLASASLAAAAAVVASRSNGTSTTTTITTIATQFPSQSQTPSTTQVTSINTDAEEDQEEALRAARLLAPPSSLLRSSFDPYDSTNNGNAQAASKKPQLVLDEDGCPKILSSGSAAALEQLRDPYALRQGGRAASERHNNDGGAIREDVGGDLSLKRRRVVVQRSAGVAGAGLNGQSGGNVVFSIARESGPIGQDASLLAERMDVDEHVRHAEAIDEDESDFVYDIFVPAAVSGSSHGSGRNGGKNGMGSSSSAIEWTTAKPTGLEGTLFVNEDDADWIGDYFYEGGGGLDEEDEDRVYSDDEDSNAEDYYGADYPEDEDEDFNETDSDDEYA